MAFYTGITKTKIENLNKKRDPVNYNECAIEKNLNRELGFTELSVIRPTIVTMLNKKKPISLNSLLARLKDDYSFITFGRTSLWNYGMPCNYLE